MQITIIGGGLAGTEAALQAARRGVRVVLYEMRPVVCTPAHQTDRFGELVCSNSLKSDSPPSASWLLKEELRRLDCRAMAAAEHARVPGGQALTVDRVRFAEALTTAIESEPLIEVRRQELTEIPESGVVVIATGPLTSDRFAAEIGKLTGAERLFFYDSISPILDAQSIDMTVAFRGSRYGKSIDGTDDYLNCAFSKGEYEAFVHALLEAQAFESHIAEDIPYFEACLPIEEIARRGPETLRFGPMKPMGLIDPRTGRRPYACVQLRQENLRADSWNLVGFQNHLRFPEQKRVLRMIPGLQNAEFLRYGQIHRNTYINAPTVLLKTLQMKTHPRILFAGQISGVEGYVESIATGLIAGRNAAAIAAGEAPEVMPRESALGALCHYITGANARNYQPANIAMDLFPPLEEALAEQLRHDKRARHEAICRRALERLDAHTGAHV